MRKSVLLSAALLGSLPAWAGPSREAAESLKRHIQAEQIAAPALRKFAVEVLMVQCENPVLVREAKRQNAQKVPLDKIKALDKEWMASPSTAPFKTALLAAPASKELQRVARETPAVKEAFLMDDQGAVVGETNATSDYWQGDEDKWIKSFAGGKGTAHVAAAEYDASAGNVLQQISLPLFDEAGKVIGAVTWGVVLEKIDWRAPAKPEAK